MAHLHRRRSDVAGGPRTPRQAPARPIPGCLASSDQRSLVWSIHRATPTTQPRFAPWWSQYDVERVQETEKVIDHPAVGRLTLRQTVLQVVDSSSGLYLILYTPALETDTAEKLQKLAINGSSRR